MAHALDFSRGKAAIAYVGETPWHGLGQPLTPNQPLEVWQKEAGLDWKVQKASLVYHPHSNPELALTMDNRCVLYRDDTNAALGVVSDSHFKVVQPGEMLEFYRDLISDFGYSLETAGSLKGGQRIWALANMGKNFRAGKDDELKSYLLFATGMDGSFSTTVKLTSVRVVCNNTLSMAIPSANGGKKEKTNLKAGVVNVSHRANFDAEAVKIALGLLPSQIKEFAEITKALTGKQFTDRKAKEFFIELLVGAGADEEEANSVESRMNDLMLAYTKGPGSDLATAKGTAWGAVNAVTYFVDHVAGRARDTALNKAWFGANDRLKTKALELAMDSAKLLAA